MSENLNVFEMKLSYEIEDEFFSNKLKNNEHTEFKKEIANTKIK